MSPNWFLAVAAGTLFLAGCASEPAKPEVAAAEKVDCRGVAPATGTLIRKKEDCVARAPMSPEEMQLDEFRRTQVRMPRPGGGS